MNIQSQTSFQRYISIKLSFYNKIELDLKNILYTFKLKNSQIIIK